ncbi:MAG: hypothetical protein JWP07_779 [Pseudonocardiales bacterium]|jgi:hypothetical protein|nr:hypothetical protein [Pseudonocardiales bacterium]
MVAVLSSDHESITGLLSDPVLTAEDEHGDAAREQLVAEMVRHFVAEEQYLFPTVREQVPGGEDLAKSEVTRDRECEKQLRLLEDDDINTDQLAAVLVAVRASFARHVQDQVALFAALEQHCDPATLAQLGEGVLGAEQLAPTRPRHIAPTSAGANKVTSLVTGFIDQVRDHYTKRGIDPDTADG